MSQMTICLILFVLTLIGFAVGSSYVSITVISLISMMVMVLTGCLEPATALGGFANGSAILMASLPKGLGIVLSLMLLYEEGYSG